MIDKYKYNPPSPVEPRDFTPKKPQWVTDIVAEASENPKRAEELIKKGIEAIGDEDKAGKGKDKPASSGRAR